MTQLLIPRGSDRRLAPVEYRDAVALYARQHGGGGDIIWMGAPVNCWRVQLTLKPDDPRLKGKDDEVYETVDLQQYVHPDPTHPAYPRSDPKLLDKLRRHPRNNRLMPGYVAFELDELGVSGVTEMLERGSLFSGRGEFQSAEEAMRVIMDRRRGVLAENRQRQRDETGALARDVRRRVLKIPFLPVGISFQKRG